MIQILLLSNIKQLLVEVESTMQNIGCVGKGPNNCFIIIPC